MILANSQVHGHKSCFHHQSQKDTPRTSSTKVPSDLGIVTAASGRALKLSVLHMTSPFSLALRRDTQVKGIATSSLGWAMFSKVCLVESSQRRKWFTSSYSYSKNLSKICRFVGFPNEIQTWRQIRPSQGYWYAAMQVAWRICALCVCARAWVFPRIVMQYSQISHNTYTRSNFHQVSVQRWMRSVAGLCWCTLFRIWLVGGGW